MTSTPMMALAAGCDDGAAPFGPTANATSAVCKDARRATGYEGVCKDARRAAGYEGVCKDARRAAGYEGVCEDARLATGCGRVLKWRPAARFAFVASRLSGRSAKQRFGVRPTKREELGVERAKGFADSLAEGDDRLRPTLGPPQRSPTSRGARPPPLRPLSRRLPVSDEQFPCYAQ